MKEHNSKRFIYVLLGLVLLMGLITAIVIYDRYTWGAPKSAQELALIGTWVGTQGNSLQLKADGSAIGREGGATGIYRWKADNGVLSIEACPQNPGPMWFARKCVDDFMNASRRDDYQLTNQDSDTLILKEVNSTRVLEFMRSIDATN